MTPEAAANWTPTRLSWVAETIVPQRDKPTDLTGDVPWVRIEDFNGKYISESHSGQGVNYDQIRSMPLRVFPPKTVVTSCSCTMGATAITTRPLITNQTFIGLVPDESRLSADFLYYLMQAKSDELQALATGAIQQYLSQDDFRSMRFALPPVSIQRRIADYLDRETAEIDAFISDLRELSALTTEHLRSEAAELLTPPPGAGGGWISSHLGPLISITTGQVDPQEESYKGMPLIAPNHIESRTSRLLGLETAEEQGADSGKYLAKEGQVLFSKIRPTLMKSTLAPVDCLTSADMYPIDSNPRFLTNAFLLEYLLGPQFEDFAARESARVAMPKLNRETLSAAPISLPPLEYQHRVVKKMQEARFYARKHLTEVENAMKLGQERRSALISAAVTGQIDVTRQGVSAAEQLRDELEVHV
ncbi:restriction endonuclease subunit S [Corynebacterium sanguinis]|uniref:Type I restriction modification DNA specificity domain-containing protein n=1 Tax=Corynebacterium sanguinis TaxID=2594913 RepID=A0A6C1U5C3_9CORY|nr:restriction endonuclease subunit S [Corynebacterium sanguinis]TVS30422.1 hypothetical protein EKI59_01190 [Corynebacterium sanguinis]